MADDTHEATGSPAAESMQERFRRLQRRARESAQDNRHEIIAEHRRQQVDPRAQARQERRQMDAEEELAKMDARDRGEDYERKRAWDWTMEESERWDRRMRAKDKNRHEAMFQNYEQLARNEYEQLSARRAPRALPGAGAPEAAAGAEDGAGGDLDFVNHKPAKEDMDRLLGELRKRDEKRENRQRRRKFLKQNEVSYINEENRAYNMKLVRYYDKVSALCPGGLC